MRHPHKCVSQGMGGRGSAVPTYVLSHDGALVTARKTHVFSGDLRDLIAQIKSAIPEGKEIRLFGGGVPFFGRISQWKQLALRECRSFPSGIVLLDYQLSGPTD